MSYNRARLKLGQTSVGTWVLLSVFLLMFEPSPLLLLKIYLVVSLPFDLVGGQILPRVFGQSAPGFVKWLWTYLRSLVVHSLILISASTGLYLASRFGLLLPVALLQFLLVLNFRTQVAHLAGSVTPESRSQFEGRDLQLLESASPGFSGGVAGFGGSTRILVPVSWPESVRQVIAQRRKLVIAEGGYLFGQLVAIGWNVLGLLLLAPKGALSPESLSRLILSMTLWTFLGLLTLPRLSRSSVFWADLRTRRRTGEPAFQSYLDFTHDEADMAKSFSEPTFYPIPSKSLREQYLQEGQPASSFIRPWACARTALYLSVCSPSLLSRAVHCNVGRPALWFFPPCD